MRDGVVAAAEGWYTRRVESTALRGAVILEGYSNCSLHADCNGPRCARPVGAVAQLGERLVRNEEVSGSIPLSSTKTPTENVDETHPSTPPA